MLSVKDLTERLKKQRHEAEENDARRRAAKAGIPYLDLISASAPTQLRALELVPEAEAKRACLAPLELARKQLLVAVFDPVPPETKTAIARLGSTYEVRLVIVSRRSLEHVWSYYQYISEEAKDISGRVEINQEHLESSQATIKSLGDLSRAIEEFKSPLISQLLEIILAGALALEASDIHLEPMSDAGTLRLRIDGLLHTVYERFLEVAYRAMVTRVKLLSNLKINRKDQPQDGRFTITLKDRNIEIRTSVIPSEYGETLVLRLLDPTALKVNLEDLGWRDDDLAVVKQEIAKPNGLILNTGPTGSGKTTTLYAFLKFVYRPEIKIITVEDPVEYHLAGISQTQVNTGAGYTFASGLRSILRQDPNIILVGEIRDQETAEIAMNAALTGHIVFSTLHTNDSVGAVPRLIDLGAKPQILGPALSLVIAQRLVRILCEHCRKAAQPDGELRNHLASFLKRLPARVNRDLYAAPSIYQPVGCDRCGHLGYHGRTSIFELFVVNEAIEQEIYKNPTELSLKALAEHQGMTTMQQDGILKVLRGITSFAEVERVTGPITWTL